ncbi:MAG TPA: hypothetical protein VK440_03245, partial [Burkholderiales bacterium]|nr:hypothetical protein [Burkholderiales bacterium]
PQRVRSVDTNFHLWARPLLEGLPEDFSASPSSEQPHMHEYQNERAMTGKKSPNHYLAAVRHWMEGW